MHVVLCCVVLLACWLAGLSHREGLVVAGGWGSSRHFPPPGTARYVFVMRKTLGLFMNKTWPLRSSLWCSVSALTTDARTYTHLD
ncbi:hypothetical protein E2C01_048629 [Portunus trituberculatus]|uniref:Secreted protein n=1 Tax=Portunus trituberculatus TaxID=210409 RepID=A0A5B7GBK0_PORTR|nr:hypothetical protein [Portunus trituberculatus]